MIMEEAEGTSDTAAWGIEMGMGCEAASVVEWMGLRYQWGVSQRGRGACTDVPGGSGSSASPSP